MSCMICLFFIVVIVVLRLLLPGSLERHYRKRRAGVPKFDSIWDEARYLRTLSSKVGLFRRSQRDRYYHDKWVGLMKYKPTQECWDAVDDQVRRYTEGGGG